MVRLVRCGVWQTHLQTVLWWKGADFSPVLPSDGKCDDNDPPSAWLLDVSQRWWEPTPTLLDVCKAESYCLSGKYSSDIHIFHSRVGSLLRRKSRHSNAERFASSSESTCHVPRCLATAEMTFLSLSTWPYLVQWCAVSQTVAEIKSQTEKPLFTPKPSNIEKVKWR